MENQSCLVEEYVANELSKTGVTVMGIEDIMYAEVIKKGVNGVYCMKSSHEDIAVFKPNDEETFNRGVKNGGYKANREVAACVLDQPRFGRVPPTSFARATFINGETRDCKNGSLQKYVMNQEWTPREEVFRIEDVQRMSVLDIRFGNNDRHNGNILLSNTNGGRLIPIDHGECFPSEWDNYSFNWITWDQASKTYPSYMIDYVKDLDVKKDLDVLKENGIELGERAEYVYKVQNKVLKAGVLGGYTPKEIGSFMTKVYRSSKTKKGPRTIIDVMNSMSGVPEAWSTEESEQLELIKEKTESALDYNKSQKFA